MAEQRKFRLVEASIQEHREALANHIVTSVDLVLMYLLRISTYDLQGPSLNSFTSLNPAVFEEARASDKRRASGLPIRPLEGIPYTLKDSYKYAGLTIEGGSPALQGVLSSEDSYLATKLRAAGAVLLGQTNMPPMACGGMQRGLYGRAESPYNLEYLTAAFSSGSSNGAATSTAASFAAFALGSETVSSGRSPASNNGLVCYTPSRGVLSCRGLLPLYVTCDIPVPYTRSLEDMMEILNVITEIDNVTKGDFWRAQPYVKLPKIQLSDFRTLKIPNSLQGKRIGVPRMYIGQQDNIGKPVHVTSSIVALWNRARSDLESLGAEVIITDFPLVTNYEDDSISGEANNVVGAPSNWNLMERRDLIAKAWDDFFVENNDPTIPSWRAADPSLVFPKPPGYIPDIFVEVKNLISYPSLVGVAQNLDDTSLLDLPGMSQALPALEAQRKRDLEDWMDTKKLDLVVFPANGDVGRADLEEDEESARLALRNGVKYSNGNRALRHLGVPTISVSMGIMEDTKMPVNLTFVGKAYDDRKLLEYAYAFEQRSKRRVEPPLTPDLKSDIVSYGDHSNATNRTIQNMSGLPDISILSTKKELKEAGSHDVHIRGQLIGAGGTDFELEVYMDGEKV